MNLDIPDKALSSGTEWTPIMRLLSKFIWLTFGTNHIAQRVLGSTLLLS